MKTCCIVTEKSVNLTSIENPTARRAGGFSLSNCVIRRHYAGSLRKFTDINSDFELVFDQIISRNTNGNLGELI